MIKQTNHKFLFVFILILPLLFTSCVSKIMKKKKIAGTWEEINHFDPTGKDTEQWVFGSDGVVNIYYKYDTTLVLFQTGEWAIQQKLGSAFLSLVVEPQAYYPYYEISTLKKTAMVLTVQDGGQYLREFEKVE